METKQAKSLGSLRAVEQPTDRHPRLLGQMKLQRHTMKVIVKQLHENQLSEVICNLAGWINQGSIGSYLTIELSPKFVSKQQEPVKPDPISELLGGGEAEDESWDPQTLT